MHPSSTPLPYYPAPADFGVAHDELFGFKVGTNFKLHAHAFGRLAPSFFDVPPPRTEDKAQEFALSRKHFHADGTDETHGILYFQYDDQGILTTIALAFAGEPCGTIGQTKVSAEKIRAFIVGRMGAEMIRLARIDSWAIDPITTPSPDVAYAGAWGAFRDATPVGVATSEEFADAVDAVKGPFMTASVTRTGNRTLALVTVRLSVAD